MAKDVEGQKKKIKGKVKFLNKKKTASKPTTVETLNQQYEGVILN